MSYNSRVYRILIASPSDVEEEREIVVRAIQEWNDLHSYNRKVTLLPLRWETHTAPEFGTRPQEVINRAIVDNCDLLVGIFWTRIGSPTGSAESGTLEEIDRVGKAGKPIMLYFSKVGVDPDLLEFPQLEKLKRFKENSYPKGLLENYKSLSEFHDKFARQLELKIRDLQKNEEVGNAPLSLEFFSLEREKLSGATLSQHIIHPRIVEIPEVITALRPRLNEIGERAIRERACFPLLLAVVNNSSSGVRNIYAELMICSGSKNLQVFDSFPSGPGMSMHFMRYINVFELGGSYEKPQHIKDLYSTLDKLRAKDGLKKQEAGWRTSFEWDALQPKRTRVVEPVLFVYSPESTTMTVQAKIFADSFSEPLKFDINVEIIVEEEDIDFCALVPDWEKILKVNEDLNAPPPISLSTQKRVRLRKDN
ncbi:DUF4062 domain-containing protein [Methylocystis rosea]|uniref:DUF4062 domain-containing protein n=1 Tax=Methylocystis rosea TaxID=173366 RepID=A0ABX6EIK0_9HYPH|nr:hypothetical protein [Methylocystis rosea]QGM93241.1 DUF4062 domain-containing protein [Methylocystis rosea]